MTSSIRNWLLFTLLQRDKVKWVCVTLNEGYLRSANRGSNNLYRFLIKITDQHSMKRRIFLVCLFYCFFRLPIYESIAAIFWQSASYVFCLPHCRHVHCSAPGWSWICHEKKNDEKHFFLKCLLYVLIFLYLFLITFMFISVCLLSASRLLNFCVFQEVRKLALRWLISVFVLAIGLL